VLGYISTSLLADTTIQAVAQPLALCQDCAFFPT
jgi:hypothetical protein